MDSKLPYTLYTCPCTKNSTRPEAFDRIPPSTEEEEEEEEEAFYPKSPRAKFALYPLEHLLFCNECHEVRCPRCYYEESTWYYCPTCLFDVQMSSVKHETNRCSRSCFQCPICIAPLGLQSFQTEDRAPTAETTAAREGQCILVCQYCGWSSLEIGIKFEKPVNISGQLAKLSNFGSQAKLEQQEADPSSDAAGELDMPVRSRSTDQYTQLVAFYKAQMAESAAVGQLSFGHTFGLDSPSQLTRLLSTYGIGGLKKQRGPVPVMREALSEPEGLRRDDLAAEVDAIRRMHEVGWDGLASTAQQAQQTRHSRFLTDLRPVATALRSKRAKRCRTCRHILAKFDRKRERNKYDLRIVALSFLPTISLRPMESGLDLAALRPQRTVQFLLTLRNPMFDSVRVTLATPPTTPGRVASRITILCPQFGVGANADAFEDAIDGDVEGERRRARDALEGNQAVAGKVWDRGRNWTTVILEVVPGALGSSSTSDRNEGDDSLLEIPILVRMDYETDESSTAALVSDAAARAKEAKIRREMVFWCVVAVGRIASSQP